MKNVLVCGLAVMIACLCVAAVSNARTYPSTGVRGVDRYCQLGPTTRHADDLMPLLTLLSKPDTTPSRLATPDPSLKGVTVFVLNTSLGSRYHRSRVDPAQHDAVDRAATALGAAGVTVRPLPTAIADSLTAGADAFKWWAACMDLNKPHAFADIITEGLGGRGHEPATAASRDAEGDGHWFPLIELATAAMGLPSARHTMPAVGLAVLEMVSALVPDAQRFKDVADMGKVGVEWRVWLLGGLVLHDMA